MSDWTDMSAFSRELQREANSRETDCDIKVSGPIYAYVDKERRVMVTLMWKHEEWGFFWKTYCPLPPELMVDELLRTWQTYKDGGRSLWTAQ